MDIVTIDQLLTVGGFLAVLLAALYVVQANKGKLKGKLSTDRRMAITEVTALGADSRAMLLNVDGQEFLIVTAKRQAPVVTPLNTKAASVTPAEVAQIAQVAA